MTPCNCCGANNWVRHKYTNTTHYFQCMVCNYYFQVKESVHDKECLFETEQLKFYGDNSLFLSPVYEALNSEIINRRDFIVRQFLSPGASVVEVGPGSGDLILLLSTLGYLTTAVEHSATLAKRLLNRKNIAVIVGDFANQQFLKASYDAYLSFHVIEHVVDFKKHLIIAHECVKPNGYAIIATPNSQSWEHRLPFSLSPNYDSSHFQLFSGKSLTLVLKEAGWDVVNVTTPCYSIAWLRVITKVLRRIRGQDENATGGQYAMSSSKALRAAIVIFANLTLPFRWIQERMAGGNELLIVARRSH